MIAAIPAGLRPAPRATEGRGRVALIDLGAVERNCRRLRRRAHRRRRAVRRGQGRRLRARRRRLRPRRARRRRRPARGRHRRRGGRAARGLPDAPLLVLGALTPTSSSSRSSADADVARLARRRFSSWSPRAAGARGPAAGPRQVRHRDGPARRARPGRGARAAGRRRRRAAERRARRAAGPTSRRPTSSTRRSSRSSSSASRELALPLRERHPDLLLHAANSAATLREPGSHFDMVRCGIADLRARPVRRGPRRAGARAGARAALLRRRREALRARRQRRLRAHDGGRRAETRSGCCRSATATGSAAACPTTRTSWSAGAAGRSSARSRWTTSPSTWAPGPTSAGRRAVLIGAQGDRADPGRGARRRGSARSTTRSPAGSRPRVPRELVGAR